VRLESDAPDKVANRHVGKYFVKTSLKARVKKKRGAMRRVRVGIIGAGAATEWAVLPALSGPDAVAPPDSGSWWGRRAGGSSDIRYQAPARPEVVALCDEDGERARRVAEAARVRAVYSDWRLMLREVEMDALLCLVTPAQAPEIIASAGAAVRWLWIDGPPATSSWETLQLARRLQGRSLRVWCAHPLRQAAAHRAAWRLIERGTLGEVSALNLRWSTPFHHAPAQSLPTAVSSRARRNVSSQAAAPAAEPFSRPADTSGSGAVSTPRNATDTASNTFAGIAADVAAPVPGDVDEANGKSQENTLRNDAAHPALLPPARGADISSSTSFAANALADDGLIIDASAASPGMSTHVAGGEVKGDDEKGNARQAPSQGSRASQAPAADDLPYLAASYAALDVLLAFGAPQRTRGATSSEAATLAATLAGTSTVARPVIDSRAALGMVGRVTASTHGGATSLWLQFASGAGATALFAGAESWNAPFPRLEVCGTQGRSLICEAGRRLWLHQPREASHFLEPPGLAAHVSQANLIGLAEDLKSFLAAVAESSDAAAGERRANGDQPSAAGNRDGAVDAHSLSGAARVLSVLEAAGASLRSNAPAVPTLEHAAAAEHAASRSVAPRPTFGEHAAPQEQSREQLPQLADATTGGKRASAKNESGREGSSRVPASATLPLPL